MSDFVFVCVCVVCMKLSVCVSLYVCVYLSDVPLFACVCLCEMDNEKTISQTNEQTNRQTHK